MEVNLNLAKDCAKSFSIATGIGVAITGVDGSLLYEHGYGCHSCEICALSNLEKTGCTHAHLKAVKDASRFGGKYIYVGPLGLTCFVSPLVGDIDTVATITAGPFLMVERQDYIELDLQERYGLSPTQIESIAQCLEHIPVLEPNQVTHLSNILFMAVGFINNVSDNLRMMEIQELSTFHSEAYGYFDTFDSLSAPPPYPYQVEQRLLDCVAHAQKEGAHTHLNELFGYILFSSGSDFSKAYSMVTELLVLIARAAIAGGGDPQACRALSHRYLNDMKDIRTIDELCLWLSNATNRFMERIFAFLAGTQLTSIQQIVAYMNEHLQEKLTLKSISQQFYLSPEYLSRLFKKEMEVGFATYLSHIRIERGKLLLRDKALKLIDVAALAGFEDQSYFTKVFRAQVGVTPLQYRVRMERRGIQSQG